MSWAWTEADKRLLRLWAQVGGAKLATWLPYYYGAGPGRKLAYGPKKGAIWTAEMHAWLSACVSAAMGSEDLATASARIGAPRHGVDCSGFAALWVGSVCSMRRIQAPAWVRAAPSAATLQASHQGVPLEASRAGNLYFVGQPAYHVMVAMGQGYILGAQGGHSTTYGNDGSAGVKCINEGFTRPTGAASCLE